jgi:hypothetical protein
MALQAGYVLKVLNVENNGHNSDMDEQHKEENVVKGHQK